MTQPSPTHTEPQKLSRRQALKALAAAGGALTAAAFLPARWVKPLVETGVLPVHAQGSLACAPPYTFASCPVVSAAWERDNVLVLYVLVTTYAVQVSPACAGVSLCLRPQLRIGDQVVYDGDAGCYATDAAGQLVGREWRFTSTLVDTATRVGWVVSMADNPAETCEAFIPVPPLPGQN